MFERIVVVDWSANARPKRGADSIWVCTLDTRQGTHEVVNHPTRRAARDALVAQLAATRGRVLVGADFPFGYPAGFATRAGLPPELRRWEGVWTHLSANIADDERNRNNRWAVARGLNRRLGTPHFWGAPPSQAGPDLPSRKPTGSEPRRLPEFRHVERRQRADRTYPFSVWQLLGAGSVGSQTLTGIPVLQHLRTHPVLAHRVRVWPFETGLVADPTAGRPEAIVLAEVWPSAIGFDHVGHPVKDARQVIALAHHLAAGADFTPTVDATTAVDVVEEEGWVLGVS